jgi:translocation protein SEC63
LLAGKKRGSKKERKEEQGRVEELDKALEAERTELDIEDDPEMRAESKFGVQTAVAKRAKALLWAHMLRHDLKDQAMQKGESERPLGLMTRTNGCTS